MQVEVEVKCMQFNFGGHGYFGFGDFAPLSFAFKTVKISLWTLGYSPWGSKNRIGSKKSLKLKVEVDMKCMQTNFSVCGLFGFGDFAPFSFAFKTVKISLRTMGYRPCGSKNRISSKNSCK